MKTAIVIGASGLVGTELVKTLLQDPEYSGIHVYARSSLEISHPKLSTHLIDFDKPDTWKHVIKGDVLFSALGTTLKQAGGQQAQYKIDHTYQYQFAEAAAFNDVPVYVLVSSASASPQSKLFYSRMKGELERDVKKLPFLSTYILQPSLLVGNRKHPRFGEKVGYVVLSMINAVGLFRKYRSITGKTVADAMINASKTAAPGVHIFTLDQIFNLAGTSAMGSTIV
jgi:uncharacterized protein YbjT (DUF2867 family)